MYAKLREHAQAVQLEKSQVSFRGIVRAWVDPGKGDMDPLAHGLLEHSSENHFSEKCRPAFYERTLYFVLKYA